MTTHKQVAVEYDGETWHVDEELEELLKLIWRHDIWTFNSCQENRPGVAWIQFASTGDLRRFLNLVAVYPVRHEGNFWETLYARITKCGSQGDWEYNFLVRNDGCRDVGDEDEVIEQYLGYNDFEGSVSVRFPREDIPNLVAVIRGKMPFGLVQENQIDVGDALDQLAEQLPFLDGVVVSEVLRRSIKFSCPKQPVVRFLADIAKGTGETEYHGRATVAVQLLPDTNQYELTFESKEPLSLGRVILSLERSIEAAVVDAPRFYRKPGK